MKSILILLALVCVVLAQNGPNYPGMPGQALPVGVPTSDPHAPSANNGSPSAPSSDNTEEEEEQEEEDSPSPPSSSGSRPSGNSNLGFGSLMGGGGSFFKKGEKMSGEMNEAIKGVNSAAGKELIKPLEDQEGVMRLFFTATPSVTPSPSVSPTPSTSPTPSVTPSLSATPSITPSASPAKTPMVSVSKSPSPTPSNSPPSLLFTSSINGFSVPFDGTVVDLAVQFEGAPVVAGNKVSCDVFQVAGDIDYSLNPNVRMLDSVFRSNIATFIPGVVRQANQCGVKLTSKTDDTVVWLEPTEGLGCAAQSLQIPPIEVEVGTIAGVTGCFFDVQAFCFTSECPAPEIEFTCSFNSNGQATVAPTPVVSTI